MPNMTGIVCIVEKNETTLKSRVLRGSNMNKEQVMVLLYDLSDEYIAANYNKNANDISYHLGLKDGIEGFRRFMLYYLKNCCE